MKNEIKKHISDPDSLTKIIEFIFDSIELLDSKIEELASQKLKIQEYYEVIIFEQTEIKDISMYDSLPEYGISISTFKRWLSDGRFQRMKKGVYRLVKHHPENRKVVLELSDRRKHQNRS